MTPEQMRALADRLETRCLPQIVQPDELARESADALRSAADQLDAVRALIPESNPELIEYGYSIDAADLLAILTADTAPQGASNE